MTDEKTLATRPVDPNHPDMISFLEEQQQRLQDEIDQRLEAKKLQVSLFVTGTTVQEHGDSEGDDEDRDD